MSESRACDPWSAGLMEYSCWVGSVSSKRGLDVPVILGAIDIVAQN